MNNDKYKFYYEIIISILAVISVIIVITDLSQTISLNNQPYKFIDTSILLIFWIDYIARLFISTDKLKFIRTNILDLIAILPFNSIFSLFRISRLFRLAKLTRLLKFTKLLRVIGFLTIFKKRAKTFLHTNGFIYVLYCSVALILTSSILIMYAEKQSFYDALWWSIVTATTVGYGDISPSSALGRVIAVILMLFDIGFIGMLTGTITTFFTRKMNDNKTNIDYTYKLINDLIETLDDEKKKELIEKLSK